MTDISQEAERLKQEGNDHFRSKAWEEALAQYTSALGHLPRRKCEPPREPTKPPEPSGLETGGTSTIGVLPATPPQPMNEESPRIAKARAVLNANVGACYVQLVRRLSNVALFVFTPRLSQGEHKKAVEACTEGRIEAHPLDEQLYKKFRQHWRMIQIMSKHSSGELPLTKSSHRGPR